MTVTRNSIIGEILDADRTTATYFLEMGMHCLGCPSARGESLEQACAVHGVNCDELVEKLNKHMNKGSNFCWFPAVIFSSKTIIFLFA